MKGHCDNLSANTMYSIRKTDLQLNYWANDLIFNRKLAGYIGLIGKPSLFRGRTITPGGARNPYWAI